MTSGDGAAARPSGQLPLTAAARVQGAKHHRENVRCQDAILSVRRDDAVAIAVADGHGSSPHAAEGADLAVRVAIDCLLDFAKDIRTYHSPREVEAHSLEFLRRQLLKEWVKRVVEHANDLTPLDLEDYGTTLLFVLATRTLVIMGHIGDGDLLRVRSDGTVEWMSDATTSIGDDTESLCMQDASDRITLNVTSVCSPEDEQLLILSTDGYSKSYPTNAAFAAIGPDYLTLIRDEGFEAVERHLQPFLSEVTDKGSGDDVAAGLLYWPIVTSLEAPRGSATTRSETEDRSLLQAGATDDKRRGAPPPEDSTRAYVSYHSRPVT